MSNKGYNPLCYKSLQIYHRDSAEKIFEHRLKHEKNGEPIHFLCIAVTRNGGSDGHFMNVDEVAAWVKDYRSREEAEMVRYQMKAGSGKAVASVPRASILVLVDPLPYASAEALTESQGRDNLIEAGAFFLKRDDTIADKQQFENEIEAIWAMNSQTGLAAQRSPSRSAAKDADAGAFLWEPVHKKLPDKKMLKKILKTYENADWRDLDS